jgi:Co/Zn/Cd efflux system component
MPQIGKILVIAGVILLIAGIVIWLLGDKLGWFGHLPGDIRIQKQNFSFYAPIVSMLILSIVLSLIFWLINKFFR